MGIPYVFLRPGYFMQNLTTTLFEDVKNGEILLPAGKAPFMWTDVKNIGETAANVLVNFDKFSNTAIEITVKEPVSFGEAVKRINQAIGIHLKHRSVNIFKFWGHRGKLGTKKEMIAVIIMLHYLPRLQKPPKVSTCYTEITGKNPPPWHSLQKGKDIVSSPQ